MNAEQCPYGFRVLGSVNEERRLIVATAAFLAHAECDPRAETDRECYLSAFCFGDDFRNQLEQRRTTKGFAGSCCSPWLWIDLDGDDLNATLDNASRLATFILSRYPELNDDDLLFFFSGSRGFHVGVPLVHRPPPSLHFHLTCRKLAERLADDADGIKIDTAIYDRVRCFRAPNSKHPKTGLHKRRLRFHEWFNLDAAAILSLAREPTPFIIPQPSTVPALMPSDWQDAADQAEKRIRERIANYPTGRNENGRLQRATLDFMKVGPDVGERHPRLFRAAADLTEHGAPPELVHALLTEAALDSGLPPSEVKRQIDCGIEHARRQGDKSEGGSR